MSWLYSTSLAFCLLGIIMQFAPTSSDVLPAFTVNYDKQWIPKSPMPDTMLSVGSQPAVDSLLANEPNCSRWIWGQCYFNHGLCGEGKQHATRSGDGCRIIGITSRCFKECKKVDENFGAVWGVDADEDKKDGRKPSRDSKNSDFGKDDNSHEMDGDGYLKGKSDKNDVIDFDGMWPSEDNRDKDDKGGFFADAEYPLAGLGSSVEKDMEHCRWNKAEWSRCNAQGFKTRVRKLRKNRKADEGYSCPSQKRDTKRCGTETQEAVITPKPSARLDAPCKWDQSVQKCSKCDKSTGKKSCTLPLLSGNVATCGDERNMKIDCK